MSATASAELVTRDDDGEVLAALVWRFDQPVVSVSTASIGGGLTLSAWLVNAQVPSGYARLDLDEHGAQIAGALGLTGNGVVMLTAYDVQRREVATVDGVTVVATVGVTKPVWAADANVAVDAVPAIGTVNIVVQLPVAHTAAAMVNLVATVAEAKCQAFIDWPVPGTGTPSDAVTVVCPAGGEAEVFGGPRSQCGRSTAMAAYVAITAGLRLGYEPAC